MKQLLSMVVAGVMVFLLGACGESPKQPTTTETTVTTEQVKPAEEAKPEAATTEEAKPADAATTTTTTTEETKPAE